jgi:hypothetical protein
VGLRGVFQEGMGSQRELAVAEKVVTDFRMWQGGWDWVHASLDCLKAWRFDLGGLCVVVGLCGCPETMEHVVGTCRGSPHGYEGQGVYTWVVRRVQRALLLENHRVASRSRDMFGFRKGDVVRAGDACGDGTGGVDAWCGYVGGCSRRGKGCSGSGGACILL